MRYHAAQGQDRLHAGLDPDQGRPAPAVLYTVPTDFGERVWLWCRAGITAGDLEAARDILRAACWASDVRVVVNDRRSHIVVLEVIRRLPGWHAEDTPNPAWPDLDRGEADDSDPQPARLAFRAAAPAAVRVSR